MQLERLVEYFEKSPAIRLFRSPQAPYVIDFLHQRFKASNSIVAVHSELVAELAAYQEELHQRDVDEPRDRAHRERALRDRPETYLTAWSTGPTRWLRRFLEAGQSEASYELTPESEAVLKFLGEVLDRERLGFVGTESRLRRIIQTLSDLVVRGSDDRERRLEYLRSERERIDSEIRSIETDGVVATYSPTAIRERFAEAVQDLSQLQGDFRAVEESFKRLTRDVQKRQSDAERTRGEILGYALDAEEELRAEDQGVSFDEFVRLVLSPKKQEELERVIAELAELSELADQDEGLRRIRGMIPSLLAEAQKVLRTTQRLSVTLRRLLDSRTVAGRKRLGEVLGEIRTLATRMAEAPPRDAVSLAIESELRLGNVAERGFWTPPVEFHAPELADHAPDEDERFAAFRQLAGMRRLDWTGMRRSLSRLLADRASASLGELLDAHPPQGVIEVLGYMQIAHEDGHRVDPQHTETIRIPRPATSDHEPPWLAIDVPRVTFLATAARKRARAAADRENRNEGASQ
ncbi:DUF3375 family protein [Candidatus Laterigemmans baculatus]|uniref:DUF3375 family protein n=1 Tax=Candidatus Laterigemmans baculatus TaxID=2770505 RepID=UPI0013D93F41|nr:DUF3375 family protein [Candidatus Laterigemmans baculatus]